jgi:hypothetical protein
MYHSQDNSDIPQEGVFVFKDSNSVPGRVAYNSGTINFLSSSSDSKKKKKRSRDEDTSSSSSDDSYSTSDSEEEDSRISIAEHAKKIVKYKKKTNAFIKKAKELEGKARVTKELELEKRSMEMEKRKMEIEKRSREMEKRKVEMEERKMEIEERKMEIEERSREIEKRRMEIEKMENERADRSARVVVDAIKAKPVPVQRFLLPKTRQVVQFNKFMENATGVSQVSGKKPEGGGRTTFGSVIQGGGTSTCSQNGHTLVVGCGSVSVTDGRMTFSTPVSHCTLDGNRIDFPVPARGFTMNNDGTIGDFDPPNSGPRRGPGPPNDYSDPVPSVSRYDGPRLENLSSRITSILASPRPALESIAAMGTRDSAIPLDDDGWQIPDFPIDPPRRETRTVEKKEKPKEKKVKDKLEIPEGEDEKTEGANQCTVCCENKIKLVFGCGHACTCFGCTRIMLDASEKKKSQLQCPICKKDVGMVMRFFMTASEV